VHLTPDHDPHGERDFGGIVTYAGVVRERGPFGGTCHCYPRSPLGQGLHVHATQNQEGKEPAMSDTTSSRIAELNDLCRKAPGVADRLFQTTGVDALPAAAASGASLRQVPGLASPGARQLNKSVQP
jgi:hypothetical protein